MENKFNNEPVIPKIELSQDDLHNLEIIFLHARKAVVDSETELMNLISFKKTLADKITGKVSGQEGLLNTEDLRNLEVVFLYARKANIENEKELVNIIQFKRSLVEKFNAGKKLILSNSKKIVPCLIKK